MPGTRTQDQPLKAVWLPTHKGKPTQIAKILRMMAALVR
jgi:hypothetical protein